MKKWLLLLPLVVLVPLRATADDSLVTFDGSIGVDPVSGIAGTAPAFNVVRGVLPGGFPSVIKRLHADVRTDGRPVTAIRAADTDDNAETTADPTWLSEVGNTTPDPSYPGAHAVVSAAANHVLVSVLHGDPLDLIVTSEVLSGVTRTFATLSAAVNEATLSRVFAGVHFRFDLTRGAQLGGGSPTSSWTSS
jgi:hypothetical protein